MGETKIHLFINTPKKVIIPTVTYSGHLGDRYTGLAPKLWRPKNTFEVFLFYLCFNKYVEVAINDFTMHHYFEMAQNIKMQTEEKTETKRKLSAKKFSFI